MPPRKSRGRAGDKGRDGAIASALPGNLSADDLADFYRPDDSMPHH